MSLIVKSGHNVETPKDAVLLTMDQALKYQHSIIKNWDKSNEV